MRQRVIALALALPLLAGCNEKTQQQVQDTGKAVVAEVKENAGQAVEVTKAAAADAEVTAGVKSALMASKKMDTSALNVDTMDGKVHLRGYVPNMEQRSLAEEIARNTVASGTEVVNELSVGVPVSGSPTPVDTGTALPSSSATPGTITDEVNESRTSP